MVHRALCSLFQPDTDGTRVSKCRQLSQQTRRLDPMLFQCWSSAVGGGQILKQYWVKSSSLLGSTQVSVYTHPSPTIMGGGPRVVVSTAAFHARVRGSVPGLGGLKETKNVSSPSTFDSQYCGEPP